MDRFSFFFGFYGLILGLAVTELLGGFAGMVRHHMLKKLEAQTALLAILTFVAICGTWIDAWTMMQSIALDFSDLWAPILIAMAFYLAAAVIFPRDPEQYAHLHMYFAARKRFAIAMLWAAFLIETIAIRATLLRQLHENPAMFWGWLVPYFLAVNACLAGLWFARGRKVNIALLSLQIALSVEPYLYSEALGRMVARLWR